MFGRLRGYFHKCDKETLNQYRSVYCGSCYALADKIGTKGRMILSYEFTASVALVMSLRDEEMRETVLRCPLKGIKSRNRIVLEQSWIDDLVKLKMFLMYLKAKDEEDDERGLRRYAAGMFQRIYKFDFDDVKLRLNEVGFDVEHASELVSERNAKKYSWLDESLEISSELFGEIGKAIAGISGKKDYSEDLISLGNSLGRCIDLIDMIEDLSGDLRRNQYNPIVDIYSNGSRNKKAIMQRASEDINYLSDELKCDLSISLNNLKLRRNDELIRGIFGRSIEFAFARALGYKKQECPVMKEARI
ncbi:MAG: DUF5685 family protein [bacterium]